MNENVFDLAQADTSLKKVSYKEYAGPCPRCGGSDRFHVQPGRKDGNGAWFCRGCWDPALKGWGDGIEYLRQIRGMSFTAAKDCLKGEVDSLLEQVEWKQTQALLPHNEQLQDRYQEYIKAAQALLWKPDGKACPDYLLARGLAEDTIRESRLGCIDSETIRRGNLTNIPAGIDTLYIVIPWYADGLLWRVQLRDIRRDCPFKGRYRNFKSSGDGLYLGDCLRRKYPTFLVEDEFSALTVAQEAGDLVNVVATGSTGRGHTAKWESRLARSVSVLIALDNDQDGDKAAKEWVRLLNGATDVKRWKPLVKDANDMLMQGYSIRTWVTAALDYLKGEPETIEPDPLAVCSSPGCNGEVFTFVEDGSEYGAPYCEAHYQALQQPEQPIERTSKERFQAIVKQLAGVFPGGRSVVEVLPAGTLTFEKHVRAQDQSEQPSVIRKVERDVLPSWLRPGSYDWNKQVERNGIDEMQVRRQAWLEQHRSEQIAV